MTTEPPFRADQVGSLLRPPELREARAKAKAGALAPARLKEVEDRCIRAAVARQEALGLRAVTDGEYRRDFWHLDFMGQLEGVGMTTPVGMVFQDRKSTRLNSSHGYISYAVFCLKKKKT